MPQPLTAKQETAVQARPALETPPFGERYFGGEAEARRLGYHPAYGAYGTFEIVDVAPAAQERRAAA